MIKTNLLICPTCTRLRSKPFPIAEVGEDGAIIIRRHGSGYTIIRGTSFAVFCGNCEDRLFLRQFQGTLVMTQINGTIPL